MSYERISVRFTMGRDGAALPSAAVRETVDAWPDDWPDGEGRFFVGWLLVATPLSLLLWWGILSLASVQL